ncbi:MAG: haloacid dehalogenase [Candidatus Thorarchaeota archaeon]
MDISELLDPIRKEIEADDEVREKVLPVSRDAVRKCGQSVKASHRGHFNDAQKKIEEAYELIQKGGQLAEQSDFVTISKYFDTAYQELTEAVNVLSILKEHRLTSPEEYDIPARPYLTGLADTVGELRRASLELLRSDDVDGAKGLLSIMEDILEELQTFDFPDSLVHNLRRKSDVARRIVEKTRGDVTTAVRQEKLIEQLRDFENRLGK